MVTSLREACHFDLGKLCITNTSSASFKRFAIGVIHALHVVLLFQSTCNNQHQRQTSSPCVTSSHGCCAGAVYSQMHSLKNKLHDEGWRRRRGKATGKIGADNACQNSRCFAPTSSARQRIEASHAWIVNPCIIWATPACAP